MSELTDPKLDKAEVEAVAALQVSDEEIAIYFNTTVDHLEDFYAATIKSGRVKGKIKAHQLMMELAEKDKNPRAIDFVARTILGDGGRK